MCDTCTGNPDKLKSYVEQEEVRGWEYQGNYYIAVYNHHLFGGERFFPKLYYAILALTSQKRSLVDKGNRMLLDWRQLT